MNTHAKTVEMVETGLPRRSDSVQLPAGAGVALAVLLGSVMWIGIFAVMM